MSHLISAFATFECATLKFGPAMLKFEFFKTSFSVLLSLCHIWTHEVAYLPRKIYIFLPFLKLTDS